MALLDPTPEENVIPQFPVLAPMAFLATQDAHGAPSSFMDTLPDPMKLSPIEIGITILLVTLLYWVLRSTFFKPVSATMDQREAAIAAGESKRSEAAALVEQRQADYQARLRDLRAQAFEHKKSLAESATRERQTLVEEARAAAGQERTEALTRLKTQQEAAKVDLLAQVETLSESMVQHLLKA